MSITLRKAGQYQGAVAQPGISGAPNPYDAAARASAEGGTAIVNAIQVKRRKDAAAIVADTLTTIQEQSAQDFVDAQTSSRSNFRNEGSDSADSLDLIVQMDRPPEHAVDLNGKNFSEYVLGAYDARVNAAMSGISNGIARNELQARLAVHRGSIASKAINFEANSLVDMRRGMIADSAERMGRLVLDDPSLFDDSLVQLNAFIDAAGIGAAGSAQQKQAVAQNLAYSAALGWIDINPEKAKELLSKPGAGFREHLKAAQITDLKSRATTREVQAFARERQDIGRLLDSNKQSILDTGQAIPGLKARISKPGVYDEADRDKILADISLWENSYERFSEMKNLPLNELADFVVAARPKGGDVQYKDKSAVADFLETQAKEQLKLADKDPALLVERLYPEQFDGVVSLREKSLLRLAMQEQKGVPANKRRLLTETERSAFIESIQSSSPEQVLGTLQQITAEADQGLPEEDALSPALLNELTAQPDGLSPLYNVLVQNVKDKSPVAFDLVRTLQLKEELKKGVFEGDAEAADFMQNVNQELSSWSDAVLLGSAENLGPVLQMQGVVAELAKMYVVDRGMNHNQAIRQAANKLVKSKISSTDGALVLPTVLQKGSATIEALPEKIKDGLYSTKRALISGEVPYSKERSFGGAASWMGEEYIGGIINTALKAGYWKTNRDYSGAVFMVPLMDGPLPLLGEDGQPIERSFLDMQQAPSSVNDILDRRYEGVTSGL